ncbi:hypothetical protein CEXT_229081 [Caerostris extrusa]|uniref:Uncharacterized protein n=1 Tax=Caerostris extrusa TaxID=172846 RepID=A0AAV4SRC6_CAEEX|nr:hypothetical protein CEXT_229081 [Caerostris extrusa]
MLVFLNKSPFQNTPTPFPSPNNNTEIYQLLFILKEFAQLFFSDGIQTMFNNLQAASIKEDKSFCAALEDFPDQEGGSPEQRPIIALRWADVRHIHKLWLLGCIIFGLGPDPR